MNDPYTAGPEGGLAFVLGLCFTMLVCGYCARLYYSGRRIALAGVFVGAIILGQFDMLLLRHGFPWNW